MSDRSLRRVRKIAPPLGLVLLFVLLGFVTDRDLFRYPQVRSGQGLAREKAEVVATVEFFNKIFNDFHSSGGGVSMLDRFPATTALRHDIFRGIGYVRDAGRVQVYDMADFTPVDVRITSPFSAEAVVLERWNYQYQLPEGRKPITRTRGLGVGVKYSLVREKNRWVVSAWNPVPVEEAPITEFRY